MAVCVTGRASTPSPEEIDEQYNDWQEKLEQVKQKLLASCEGDAECEANVMDWYRSKLMELYDPYVAATKERWRDARDRKKALEEELRELIPEWPDIEDILEPLLMNAIVTLDVDGEPVTTGGGCDDVVLVATLRELRRQLVDEPTSLGDGGTDDPTASRDGIVVQPIDPILVPIEPCFKDVVVVGGEVFATRAQTLTYAFEGDYTVDTGVGTVSGVLNLSLQLAETVGSDGTYSAQIIAGDGSIDLAPSTVTLSVVDDEANVIDVGANGKGWITVLLKAEHSMIEWGAILPEYNRVHLPITRDGSTLTLVQDSFGSGDFVPYQNHPASDYDLDGSLTLDLDFPAFLAGHASQSHRADIDGNEIWDDADVVAWLDRFNQDVANGG
jgi:hypothetical protein